MNLEQFNVAERDRAIEMVRPCLDVSRWVDAVVDGRPYPNRETLIGAARAAANPLTPAEIDGALVHHPRIGDRARGSGAEARHSASEQAGLGEASAELEQALHDANVNYEQCFDRVFLIRAPGRSRAEILSELRRRMHNDEATELDEIAGQLREIAIHRLDGSITS